MSQSLLYAGKVVSQLESLPPEFTEPLESELRKLSDNPVELSVPIASPPFPPRGQLYHFHLNDHRGEQWFFTVIFRYSQDETSLHILSITWRELIDE